MFLWDCTGAHSGILPWMGHVAFSTCNGTVNVLHDGKSDHHLMIALSEPCTIALSDHYTRMCRCLSLIPLPYSFPYFRFLRPLSRCCATGTAAGLG
jgi:hypothetical protein